ncbi:unnamed protein product [Chrysodeixis includens]|uniref:Uncharacterized protein n=1 Tax=Chrysodeixis includens TaxID=689277 RepID=A0A9P0BQS7_CHRIL|nr:unnamed protein product [Chrysodeixis includens]
MKASGSYPGLQYVPQPGVFVSSTTETAIPILRLSNEMDLDGSFSYEALGADQTHYVQHSRMENAGAGKDEQVVEGSYSYVGDNGKTYTVHYIADANGFRASGDHLPVAPPIPEIIQRAVQYNLAEESKKPPHLQSWNEQEKENEVSESEKRHQFAVQPPRLSSLFTGKTPSSFSHSFSQASNSQNNLVAAASSQTPIQTAIDFGDQMQTKQQNSGTISPQITFLASQGAHVPSVNTPQQTISRIFTTEKSTMPQLVNYEANIKEADQEGNKALWRWQYGLNANANQNMEKNSISRSFGADDIVINFNDMTPEQYTQMIQQQLEPNTKESEKPRTQEVSYNKENSYNTYNSNVGNNYQINNDNLKGSLEVSGHNQYSTERISSPDDWYRNQNDVNKNYVENSSEHSRQLYNEGVTSRPKLITQQDFYPHSQTVTQSYNYDDENFESRRTKILNSDSSSLHDNMQLSVLPLNYEKSQQYNNKPKFNEAKSESKITVTQEPFTTSTIKFIDSTTARNNNKALDSSSSIFKFTDFIVPESKNDFKPLFKFTEPPQETTTTTTEASMENAFEENVFLKNLFVHTKPSQDAGNKIMEDTKPMPVKPLDTRTDKHPKFIQYPSKPQNEIKLAKKKPIDMSELLNYITRNQFESNKVKSKPKQAPNTYKQTKNEVHYYAPEEEIDVIQENNNRNHRTMQQEQELRGVIKNYKVLHRNNNYANPERDETDGLRRNLSPPPMKTVNLPPLGRAGPSMKSYLPPIYV